MLGRDTNTLKDKPLLWTEPGVTSAQGRACLHQPSQGAFSLSCPCAIRPCRRGHSPQGQALFPYPGHNLPTWPWQECLHRDLLCGREGAGTYLWGGGFSEQRPLGRARGCPGLELWLAGGPTPSRPCDNSQASGKLTETFTVRWAWEGGFFSPEPGFPSSPWFADPARNAPQKEIHHRYWARSLVAYNAIIPLQIARYNVVVFFPERLKLSLNTSF